MRRLSAFAIALVLLFAVGGAFVWSGIYDIGADAPHWRVVERLIATLRQRSIETRANGIAVPDLGDPKRIAQGAEHYAGMCTGCHLAPGMSSTEVRAGLYPQPPALAEIAPLPPATAFWIIKHGIKMTAMPAWGTTHDDDAIWNLVAFVRKLPGMTPEDYRALTDAVSGGGEHEEHEHEHHHHDAAAGEPHGEDARSGR